MADLQVQRSEPPLSVFVSSVMRPDLQWARDTVKEALEASKSFVAWAFEYTPASSDTPRESYLAKVRSCDILVWLACDETTPPVSEEVRTAIESGRRLWVFKLPAATRDTSTQELLELVRDRVKWHDVRDKEELGTAVRQTAEDEIIRAIRRRPELKHLAPLEELLRFSRSRCLERWLAAGVPRELAVRLLDDSSVGGPGPSVIMHVQDPVTLLLGEIGIGKSLMSERLLQEAIGRARAEGSPIPIYLDARTAVGRLRQTILESSQELGDPRVRGAFVVIDGLDEAGVPNAFRLLEETRALSESWGNTKIILNSRPIEQLGQDPERVFLSPLQLQEAIDLLTQVSGISLTPERIGHLPASIQEAIRRPLFAILFGAYLRQESSTPRSVGYLISSLVTRALRSRPGVERALALLGRLAAHSIDRSGYPVPRTEIAAPGQVEMLLESGLVVQRGDALAFPLSILTEWFAAHSLGEGFPSAQDLSADAHRLEQWRYPLVVFVSEFDHDTVTRVLSPLVKAGPAFCAGVIDAAVSRGISEASTRVLPPSLDCGKRIYTAMESWLEGLGPLGPVAMRTREGRPQPIGVMSSGSYLIVGTYRREDDVPAISELSRSEWDNPSGTWMPLELFEPPNVSTWAWKWTLDSVRKIIGKVIATRALRIDFEPFVHEAAWRTALVLTGHGSLYHDPIQLDEIDARLAKLSSTVTFVSGGSVANQSDFLVLRGYCEHLRSLGGSVLLPPWPGTDTLPVGSWVWSGYSDDRLLNRVEEVYLTAIKGYDELVKKWFLTFAPYLKTAAVLPCKIMGELVPQRSEEYAGAPYLSWHLEALPAAQANSVSIHKTERPSPVSFERIREVSDQNRRLRPNAVIRVSAEWRTERLQIFGATPAHDLAYGWLWEDLREIGWA